MDKEEALNEFLKGLRIVLNNASAYNKEHPYFVKSVEIFKQKTDALFGFLNPIKVGFTPDSLFIDGKFLTKLQLYLELASIFHVRKIKNLEIRQGVSLDALVDFLSLVAQPPREILKQGGIQNILEKGKSAHLAVELLDYSQLLKDVGEESKNVWTYLFKNAVTNEDAEQVNEFADNFSGIIGKFRAKDLIEDQKVWESINNFIFYVKVKQSAKFGHCAKSLIKYILREKSISQDEKINKLKEFFQNMEKDDLGDLLFDEILKEEEFDYSGFQIFSRLVSEDTHKQMVPKLVNRIRAEGLNNNPKIRKKIRELFSGIDLSHISVFYRDALYSFIDSDFLESGFSFEPKQVEINYYYILLNLVAEENDRHKLELIAKSLSKEFYNLAKDRKLKHLTTLLEVLDRKLKEDPSLGNVLEEIKKSATVFIENLAFEKASVSGLENLIESLHRSYLGFDYYCEKMFKEGIVNPYVLRLFLKFFSDDLVVFYKYLENRHADLDFIEKVVKALSAVDYPLSLEILKNIFYFSNQIIKVEVLKTMYNLSQEDNDFLLSVLQEGGLLLKKESMRILNKNDDSRKKALDKLFLIPSPWGKKNKVLVENIIVAEDLGVVEAKDYLVSFSKKPFFWNRNLRRKAREALNRLGC